eukprot:CAMPEP_0194375514 /NCGR_PEP_ID=MMETSP0174-20130528/24050_1 /TAXON_ID=216777 /ORGANISM="Proboscia alata, Strain PI-D3" /LENGTH=277 /DNA_ID=CAMNT_0039155771 /DNA_START=105 /DNA_END=938 /DNA_ORIENTATION=-
MLDESKINEISGCDAVIKTSIDLPTALSTIEVQSLLLQKLRVEMSKLSERNAAMRAENSMLRHRTRRQQISRQNSDEEKLCLGVTDEKSKDKNFVRFSQENVPKLGIDNLKEDPKPSSMQHKNLFVSNLDDLITIPLEKELLMKKREIAHWKEKFVEKGDRVNELEVALRQKDKNIMNVVNESNTLAKQTLEIKDLLDKQSGFGVNKQKSKLPADSASTSSFGAKSLSSMFGNRFVVKPTDCSNAPFSLKIQKQEPMSDKYKCGEIPKRATAASIAA